MEIPNTLPVEHTVETSNVKTKASLKSNDKY